MDHLGASAFVETDFFCWHCCFLLYSKFAGGLCAFDDAHDVFLAHHEQLVTLDLDGLAGVLPEQHSVAGLDIERDEIASLKGIWSRAPCAPNQQGGRMCPPSRRTKTPTGLRPRQQRRSCGKWSWKPHRYQPEEFRQPASPGSWSLLRKTRGYRRRHFLCCPTNSRRKLPFRPGQRT